MPGPARVPWWQWKLAFLNLLKAIGGNDLTSKCRKAFLLKALGLEGQRIYYSMAPATTVHASNEKTQEGATKKGNGDAFEEALTVLDKHFSTATNELMELCCFRQRRQILGEAFETYATARHKLSSDHNFGKAAGKAVHDQLLEEAAPHQIQECLLFKGAVLLLHSQTPIYLT